MKKLNKKRLQHSSEETLSEAGPSEGLGRLQPKKYTDSGIEIKEVYTHEDLKASPSGRFGGAAYYIIFFASKFKASKTTL